MCALQSTSTLITQYRLTTKYNVSNSRENVHWLNVREIYSI